MILEPDSHSGNSSAASPTGEIGAEPAAGSDAVVNRLIRVLVAGFVIVALTAHAIAAEPAEPRDIELRELLRKLHTTARLMHTTAHPDDEDGGMLTLESRGLGAEVLLLTLNRGEGGQNKMGSNLLDVLGVLRTLELLAADRYYDVHQRFTRVADFGFSKSAEETFQKWGGHDIALSDMVRVIRQFRPDVLVSRFQGNARDGHGHHIAAGILTREAFRAAADPNRFPEQIREGLLPWQAKKLYVDNVRPFSSTATPAPDAYTVALDTDATDSLLRTSYIRYARRGLKHQQSQGAGSWKLPPGPHASYFKLVDSVLPMPPAGVHEKSLFDGIDTSLPALAARLGAQESLVPFLRPALVELERQIEKAAAAAKTNTGSVADSLLAAQKILNETRNQANHSALPGPAKSDLLLELGTKRRQLQRAIALACGIELQAMVDVPPSATPQEVFVAVPGSSFTATVKLLNRGARTIDPHEFTLNLPAGWSAKPWNTSQKPLKPGREASVRFTISVPADAEVTGPYWHRGDPERDSVFTLDQPRYVTLPFAPPPVHARVTFTVNGSASTISTPLEVSYRGTSFVKRMPLAVEPALSVEVRPTSQVVPASNGGSDVTVSVTNQVGGSIDPEVRLQLPQGWRSEPGYSVLHLNEKQPQGKVTFHLTRESGAATEDRVTIQALATYRGQFFSGGYTVITRPDLGTAIYRQPAAQQVTVVDVRVPRNLKVGYLMGAGDKIPAVLRQIGLDVKLLSPEELASGDLRAFDTIVLGIRAYDTREDLRRYNSRLLDYVAGGGTLLVQYNSGVADFNAGHYTPYPAQLGRQRVTREHAPVEVLAPQASLFHFPNRITPADFDGWVQERGLYFMSNWDAHFEPLLGSHDPGDPSLPGGLLRAQYGKGIYLYTGYSFFRQLPAGVPGAIRLFVNLISAGHNDHLEQ